MEELKRPAEITNETSEGKYQRVSASKSLYKTTTVQGPSADFIGRKRKLKKKKKIISSIN